MSTSKHAYFEYENCFDGTLDPDEIGSAFERRSDKICRKVVSVYEERGASKADLTALACIMGHRRPTDAACAANHELARLGRLRSQAGWSSILAADGKVGLRMLIYRSGHTRDGVVDLREIKRDLVMRLKGRATVYAGRTLPFIGQTEVEWHTILIAANDPTVVKARRGGSLGAAPAVDVKLGRDAGAIAEACALQWGMTPLTTSKVPASLCAELFVTLAMLPADRGMFGAGYGSKLAKSVSAELRMRSRSFDLLRRAPIRAAQIPSIVAGLPSNNEGAPTTLPSIVAI